MEQSFETINGIRIERQESRRGENKNTHAYKHTHAHACHKMPKPSQLLTTPHFSASKRPRALPLPPAPPPAPIHTCFSISASLSSCKSRSFATGSAIFCEQPAAGKWAAEGRDMLEFCLSGGKVGWQPRFRSFSRDFSSSTPSWSTPHRRGILRYGALSSPGWGRAH